MNHFAVLRRDGWKSWRPMFRRGMFQLTTWHLPKWWSSLVIGCAISGKNLWPYLAFFMTIEVVKKKKKRSDELLLYTSIHKRVPIHALWLVESNDPDQCKSRKSHRLPSSMYYWCQLRIFPFGVSRSENFWIKQEEMAFFSPPTTFDAWTKQK